MEWTLDDSRLVYGVGKNDLDFLDINSQGDLTIKFDGCEIALTEINSRLLKIIQDQGYNRVPSYTLRLPQLIKKQVKKLYSYFEKAIEQSNYKGKFNAVYPIKVNSMKTVIETIKKSNPNYSLEAGTKSELILLLKALKEQKHRTIFCNGVKDSQYLNIARQAMEDGYNLILSIESISETHLALDLLPLDKTKIALRVKPYAKVGGRWGTSSGRYSKFGLSIYEYLEVLNLLEERGKKDILVALHSHAGSQITDLKGIQRYSEYIVKRYVELHQKGFTNVSIINYGGGFPINYDSNFSLPDLIEKYVSILVQTTINGLAHTSLSHPTIMVEAGRYVTAHFSMIVVETQDVWPIFPPPDDTCVKEIVKQVENISEPKELLHLWESVEEISNIENSADIKKTEMMRGLTKQIIRQKLAQLVSKPEYQEIEFEEDLRHVKREIFASDYLLLGNFSVFNSICDHVLVKQYFPVLPISNLNVQPDTVVRIIDITCDSDGEVSMFKQQKADKILFSKDGFPLTRIGKRARVLKGIPVGNLIDIAHSYVVIALTGAYQDVIEFDHNLIGDLPDVELRISADDGKWSCKWIRPAQTIGNLLREVGYVGDYSENPYLSLDSFPIIDRLQTNNGKEEKK